MDAFPAYRKTPRLAKPVVVTEKIDGTNALVAITHRDLDPSSDTALAVVDGNVIRAGSRKRWITPDSDNFGFAGWVLDNRDELAKLGPGHHYGEWWGQGIQRGYGLDHKRFSLFDTRWIGEHADFRPDCCHVVPIIGWSDGFGRVDNLVRALEMRGSMAAPGWDRPEGAVAFHTGSRQVYKIILDKPAA